MKGGLQKWCHLFTSFCCLKTKGDQHDGVGQNLGHQQAKDRSHRSAVCRRCRWCCSLVEDRELWEVSWEAFWKLLRFLFVFFLDGRFGECSLLKLLRCWVTCTGLGMGESFLRTTASECTQSVLIETTSFQGMTGVGIIALVETHSPSSVFYLMICTLHLK